MIISKIDTPSWRGDIKNIFSSHIDSFEFKGIPKNYSIEKYEWWRITTEDGIVLGIGFIDFFENEFSEFEGEISICVSAINKAPNVGSELLRLLEIECKSKGVGIISVMIKKSNPNYEKVLAWFKGKEYQFVHDFEKDTYLIKRSV